MIQNLKPKIDVRLRIFARQYSKFDCNFVKKDWDAIKVFCSQNEVMQKFPKRLKHSRGRREKRNIVC